jgi:uncharacterized integral membrane protein
MRHDGVTGSFRGVTEERRDPLTPRQEGSGWRRWAFGFAALILLVFVIQNSATVEVEFLFTTAETPLVFALLFSGALGAVIGWAAPKLRRDSKRD